jgi:hypothetical protein
MLRPSAQEHLQLEDLDLLAGQGGVVVVARAEGLQGVARHDCVCVCGGGSIRNTVQPVPLVRVQHCDKWWEGVVMTQD